MPCAATRDRQLRNRALVRGWLYVVLRRAVRAGAGRRRDAADRFRPVDHRVEADPRRHPAAQRRRMAGGIRQVPADPAICADQQGHERSTAFKRIFWWEWAHRILARGVGFVFALPLLFFWATRPHRARRWRRSWSASCCSAACRARSAGGWWRPGLVDRVDVSQYRLATHLTLACADLRRDHGRGARPGAAFRARRPTGTTQRFAGLLRARWCWCRSISAGWSPGSMPA